MDRVERHIYRAASYLRLSNEDDAINEENQEESRSIKSQRNLVQDFVSNQKNIVITKEYVDDGVSGSSFSRPAFNEMMADIETGNIDCVIVKDLSRFGREYIDAGNLLENVFPSLGIRFIAINDYIDTLKGMDSLIVALKNIMNDAYCRDISIKTRSNLEVKRRHGEYIGAFPVYGYKKDPTNHNHLCIDSYAGQIVQTIFQWRIRGMSCGMIASKLNEFGILSPYNYKMKSGSLFFTSFREKVNSSWQAVTVRRILENEVYTGTLVQGKCTTANHKIKKAVKKEKSQWIRVSNTHEAIISLRDYEIAQKSLLLDSRTPAGETVCYPLSGILTCGGCKSGMVRRPRTVKGKQYVYYECREYLSSHGKKCSSHLVNESKVEEVILALLKTQIRLVTELDEVIGKMKSSELSAIESRRMEKMIQGLSEEVQKYENLCHHLYTDLYDNIINESEYQLFKEEFILKKETAQNKLHSLEQELVKAKGGNKERYQWMESFIRYRDIGKLKRNIVLELIDEVVVFDKDHIEVAMSFQDEYQDACNAIFRSLNGE